MALSEARKRANAKYNAKAYDEIKIRVQKGNKKIISDYAASNGRSVNGLVNELLADKIPELKKTKNTID